MEQQLKLLVVEDNPDDAELIAAFLNEGGQNAWLHRVAEESAFAAALARPEGWDAVISDYSVPGFGAARALEMVQASGLDLPFIVVSGCIGEESAVALLKAGAGDCVNKGNLARLAPAVQRELKEAANRRARRAAEHELRRLAFFDQGTGLPNRSHFQGVLQQRLDAGEAVELLHLDFCRLAIVRDTLGEAAAEALLSAIAERLRARYGSDAQVGRLGCNEFGVATAAAGSGETAPALLALFRAPFAVQQENIYVSPVVGVARGPIDAPRADTLLRCAQAAAHQARGRDSALEYFSPELEGRARERLLIGNRLREALRHGNLQVHYQPKVELRNGAVTGLEALLRWNDPELGPVSPARFIPVAEESGEIVAIGAWVLREVCRQGAQWLREGLGPLQLAVNVSVRQLRDPGFVPMVEEALRESGLPPAALELELTESDVMADIERAVAVLGTVRAMGVSVAVDDFGTGYSSLAYLKRLPIASLKVDRSFVRDLPGDADDCAIVHAIVGLAHGLGLCVVAEGVENEAQLTHLSALGCEQAQGFLFSRPLDREAVTALLSRQRGRRPDASGGLLRLAPA